MISRGIKLIYFSSCHPLSAYATKWSNTLKQFVDFCLTNPDFSDSRFRKNLTHLWQMILQRNQLIDLTCKSVCWFLYDHENIGVTLLNPFQKQLSCKKGVLKNSAKFTGKHMYLSLFLNKDGCAYFCTEFQAQMFLFTFLRNDYNFQKLSRTELSQPLHVLRMFLPF